MGERRIGRAQARVCCAVNALLFAVCQRLWGGHIGVQFDLVDRGDDLARRVVQELL